MIAPAAWKVSWAEQLGAEPTVFLTASQPLADIAAQFARDRGHAVSVEALVSLPVVLYAIKAALQENAR